MAEHAVASTDSSPGQRPVDAVVLQRAARRLRGAADLAWLHAEVARRMAQRLPLIRLRPRQVLLWDEALGGGREEVLAAYAHADPAAPWTPTCVEVRLGEAPGRAPARPAAVRSGLAAFGRHLWRHWGGGEQDAAPTPAAVAVSALPAGSAQMLWSNMGLHFSADPLQTFGQWHHALAVDGLLMFSTLGPGSLMELRAMHQSQGWAPAVTPLVDMHDLGDLLVQSGFADPVMDQERIVLTWPDAVSALRELRALGGNAHPQRHRGLRTPRWRERWLAALQALAGPDGRVALSFEIAYGHAFKPAARVRVDGETRIALEQMRAMVRPASASHRKG